jgi:hypothetical protein
MVRRIDQGERMKCYGKIEAKKVATREIAAVAGAMPVIWGRPAIMHPAGYVIDHVWRAQRPFDVMFRVYSTALKRVVSEHDTTAAAMHAIAAMEITP